MKKKAVVLIMTIGFIGVLSALILQSVSISKSSLDDLVEIKTQNQQLAFLKDFSDVIGQYSAEDFKDVFVDKIDLPVYDSKSGINLLFSCKALENRLDLNRLLRLGKPNYDDFVREFLSKYELADSEFFLALLKDTVSVRGDESVSGSKIALYDKSFSDGSLVTYKSIEQMQEYYYKEIRDKNIFNMTKKDFLDVFFLLDEKKVFIKSVATQKMCDRIGFKDDLEGCKKAVEEYDKSIKKSLKKATKSKRNDNNQTNQTKDLIQCDMMDSQNHGLVFKYDLKNKKLVSVDEFF